MRGLYTRTAGVAAAPSPPHHLQRPHRLTTAGTSTAPTTPTETAARSTTRATQAVSAVKLAAFAGKWTGHTRSLTESTSGSGHEIVYDGCCTEQIDMAFQLSNPRGTSAANARATATVTAVVFYAASGPAPKVGRTGTVSLVDGVLTDSFG